MPTLNIEGRKVTVDDSFLKLSPEQQNATVDEIVSSFKSQSAPAEPKPASPSIPERAVAAAPGLGSAFDAGVEKMIAGTGGALGDITDLGAKGLEHASNYISDKLGVPRYERPAGPSVLDNIPRSSDVQASLNERYRGDPNAGPYKAQNGPERYAEAAGEFLLGGVGGAGRRLVGRAAQIAVPAAASETAGHATEGTRTEPVARFLGALAGGGATALMSRPGTAARSIANQLPEGITEPMVVKADALMQEATQRGVQLAWPEALSQVAGRPVLTNMMRHLEASPQSEGKMASFFGDRPQAVEGAVRQELGNIAPANAAPSTIGPAVGRAANETAHDVRGVINKASEPYYKAAEAELFTPAEFAAVQKVPGYKESLEAVRKAPDAWRIEHLPDNSVGVLDKVKQHFDQQAKNAGSKFNPAQNQSVQSSLEMSASAVKQIGEAKSPDYAAALGIQQQGREKYLQPLLDGPLGKLAKKDVSTQKAIDALFPRNPLANSEQEIATAVGAVAKRNPKAASDLVRAHAESTFNEAARDLQTGPNQANGAKFRTAIVGNPQQRLNLRAAVEELPNGAERWTGFNRLLDVLEATGTRQGIGSRTAYNQMINETQGAGGLVRSGAKVAANPMKFLQPLADKYDQYKLGKNLTQLANILTDPNSAGMLRAIVRSPRDSGQATSLALRLVTYTDAARSKPVDQGNK